MSQPKYSEHENPTDVKSNQKPTVKRKRKPSSRQSKQNIASVIATEPSTSRVESVLEAAANELRKAKRILVITGAGISADSGLPTYRGIGGLYNDGQDVEDGLTIEDALSGYIMRTEPDISWKYICQIEAACRSAKPNAAHHALVSLESKFEHCTILTQNIDGLHISAGTKNLIEIHGNIHRLFCITCDRERCVTSFEGMSIPPICKRCGRCLRPRIVLFGETLPEASIMQLTETVESGIDAVISIGTSSIFPYIAGPVLRAADNNKTTIEINPNDTKVSHAVRYHIRERSVIALPALLAYLS